MFAFFLSMFFLNTSKAYAILLDKVVAVIDKEVITWSELYKTMEFDLKDKTRGMASKDKIEFLKNYEKEFLERMIEIKLLLSYGKKAGITVSDKAIDSAMTDIRNKYNLTEEQFKQAIAHEGFDFDGYREKLGEQIMLARVTNEKINSKVSVSDDEVNSYLNAYSSYSRQSTEPINSAADNSGYKIRLLQLKIDSPDEIDELKKKAYEIVAKVGKGADFASLVQEFSTGPNVSEGGDLGYIQEEDMAPVFFEAVSVLSEGQVSKPFVANDNVNIVQLIDKSGAEGVNTANHEQQDYEGNLSFSEAKQMLLKRKAAESYKKWIKSLKENSVIKIML